MSTQQHTQDYHDPFRDSFSLTNCDAVDSGMTPPGYYTCHSLQVDHFGAWSNLSKENYREKKKILFEHTIKRVEQYAPGFRDIIDLHEVGTPKTMVRYTKNPNGAIYGFHPGPEAFKQRSHFFHHKSGSKDRTIKNLYFASAWAFLPSFFGVMSTGHKTAKEIIKDWC